MFTESPSAVKSEISSLDPSVPTYAMPVCTPPPTGIGPLADASDRAVASMMPAAAVDRFPGMVPTRVARDVQADGLVADELVDDAVRLDDGTCREPIERGEQRRERRRPEPLTEAGRASDVDEQHRDLDLGAADALLGEGLHAVLAQLRVALPRPEPWLEQCATDAMERRVAELAARRGRQTPETPAQGEHGSMLTGQDRAPLLLGRLLFHARSLSRPSSRTGPPRRPPAPGR